MSEEFKAEVIGADRVIRRMERTGDAITSPNLPLMAVRRVAGVWKRNFEAEGDLVGGWPDLAEYTQDIREEQGYNRDHPILQRDGSLLQAAITEFQRRRTVPWRGRSVRYNWATQDSYGSERSGKRSWKPIRTSASMDVVGGRARLRVWGWKVTNQWGFSTSRGIKVPARPFWFIGPEVSKAARAAVSDAVGREMRKP